MFDHFDPFFCVFLSRSNTIEYSELDPHSSQFRVQHAINELNNALTKTDQANGNAPESTCVHEIDVTFNLMPLVVHTRVMECCATLSLNQTPLR